ncbi:MAG: flavodoxin [Phototrophicaceae bacterium]|jgi:flavodoxin I
MAKIGLFFGSSTGATEAVAFQLADAMNQLIPDSVEVHNIGATTPDKIVSYQYLIFGLPTWNTGQLQDDWEIFLPNFRNMNLKGKKIAMFGLGDQNGYGFNFLDALGMLADEVLLAGGEVHGLWSTKNYQFNESKAQVEEYFLGLGIDQDGQADLTPGRIQQWVKEVKQDFGL